MERTASKLRRPQFGEVLEAEMLAAYPGQSRGTLVLYRDCITIFNGFSDERFDLVKVAQGVRWQQTHAVKGSAMHRAEAVHRRHERLKASPTDPRIRQLRGLGALDLAKAKSFTLDVAIRAWRVCTGEPSYEDLWDVKPDSVDMKGSDLRLCR